jgi:hypothetical protein
MVLGMTVFSQEFDNGKLDRYFNALADHDKFMGSMAVSRNGELVYTRSVGFTDVEKGVLQQFQLGIALHDPGKDLQEAV